ncbi:MAG: hypothetical protein AB8G15_03490 [Saprospiraceae bacterium]
MNIKQYVGLIVGVLVSTSVFSQKDHNQEVQTQKVESLKDFFTRGHLHGHIRNYFMATVNEGDLTDYWTNGIGGAIKYETYNWKGFQLGVKGIFTYQSFSADLNKQDEQVAKGAKWEKELYDVNRPYEKKDLDRLEELYIKYNYKKSFIKLGKIDLNTSPLLLRRDGRMKPFVYRGLWAELQELKNQSIYIGWINGVSPRGMTEWYSINEAVGILNNGFQYDGSKASYHEFSQTRGIGVLGYKAKIKNISLQIWDYYFDRMNNTLWLQADYDKKNLFGGIQYVIQNACAYQNEIEFEHRYFQPDEMANVFALQIGYQSIDKIFKISSSFLHGFGIGRFLFPKELGRENFYVSQPRSWIDGYGLVNVYMIRGQLRPINEKWKGLSLDIRLSYVDAPDQNDFANNKYGRTDYTQITLLTKYAFQKKMKGLEMTLLYVLKYSPSQELLPSETFYKTNLHHFNLIANINF